MRRPEFRRGESSPTRRRTRGRIVPYAALAVALALAACTPPPPDPEPSVSATPDAVEVDTSTLRTLIDSPAESPTLTIGDPATPLAGEEAVTVTYPSGGLTVSGVLRTPRDVEDAAPVVVVVHGSVDPDRYEPGSDLATEQRRLLEAGYIVFALDLRGYAGSDASDDESNPVVDPGFGWNTVLDWGMAWDVVNGLRLAASGAVPGTTGEQVGLVGHSLGGLLSIDAAVIAPGLSQLVVALSAPTTDFGEALEEFGDDLASASPTLPPPDDPYWTDVSPATFFDRASEPLLLIHGADDEVAPAEWSPATASAWEAAGGRAETIIIPGADHALSPGRGEVADIVVEAFDTVFGRL